MNQSQFYLIVRRLISVALLAGILPIPLAAAPMSGSPTGAGYSGEIAPDSTTMTLYVSQDQTGGKMPHLGDSYVEVYTNECVLQEFYSMTHGLFQFDLSPIPQGVRIENAEFRAYGGSDEIPRTVGVHRVQSAWNESGAPPHVPYSDPYVSRVLPAHSSGWQSWDVTQLVRDWRQGTYPNYGLALVDPDVLRGICWGRIFDSREKAGGRAAQLVVRYTTSPQIACADLTVDAVEVTQAIQDDANTVPLVANKRTYVRGHVRSAGATCPNVRASFLASRFDVSSSLLYPQNPGGRIAIGGLPDRDSINDSFYTEIPPQFLGPGGLRVCLLLNEDKGIWEPNYDNNSLCVDVTLTTSPPVRVRLYDVQFQDGQTQRHVDGWELWNLVMWLRRAYPTASVEYTFRAMTWTGDNLPSVDGCGEVNNQLATLRRFDGSPSNWRYYGMVSDGSGFMRGCAQNIPSFIASGPTGDPAQYTTTNWDTDRSYGDWYGGHELAHTYGRTHANFCTAVGGDSYPYPNGIIGGPINAPTRYRGFDIFDRVVYPSNWTDIMTYCSNEWISDFTYSGLRTRLVSEENLQMQAEANDQALAAAEGLLVVGRLNRATGAVRLDTLYRWGMAGAPTGSGEWRIALYSGTNLLQSSAFTPKADSDVEQGQEFDSSVVEVVPWVAGTNRIAILHNGNTMASRTVSAHAPVITVITPNGGENLTGPTAPVRWSASDDDGDALVYSIQYSRDLGKSFETLAANYRSTEYLADVSALPGSKTALFRVIASDGVNTAEDRSNNVFTVSNKPPMVRIVSPTPGTCLMQAQQLMLVGAAYDLEEGAIPGGNMVWGIDGQFVGSGEQLAIASLPVGRHEVVFSARDENYTYTSTYSSVVITEAGCRVYLPLIER